jgi:hypothetical protein
MYLHIWNVISGISAIVMALFTILIYFMGRKQLKHLIKLNKVEFTYKVDREFSKFINNPINKRAKDWLLNNTPIQDNETDAIDNLCQLFDKLESIYALWRGEEIDYDMFYQLLSYYFECVFIEGKVPNGRCFISDETDRALKKGISNPHEMYEGIAIIHKEILKRNKNESNKIIFNCLFL